MNPHFLLLTSYFLLSLSALAAYDVPSQWQPRRYAGAPSDFIFVSLPLYGREIAAFDEIGTRHACISNMVRSIRFEIVRRPDGTFTYDLDHPAQPIPEKLPFVGVLYPRVSVTPREVLLGKVRHDKPAYEAWLRAHPNFLGFTTCEYLNDIDMPLRDEGRSHIRGLAVRDPHCKITDAEFEEICARPEYRNAIGNPKAIATDLIPKYLSRLVEMQFGDARRSIIGEGTFCVEHLAAYAGVGALGIETTRNYCPYQLQEMFCRGAARQFGLPWYWYIATYFLGYERDGTFNPNCYRTASRHGKIHGPNFGLSLSAIERTMWKAWLSGACSYEREAMTDSLFDTDAQPWQLSDEGLLYERYYNVVTTHERGVPYTPIALLVPMCRGESRALGKPFTYNMKCPYTHADHMTDALLATALDFPNNMTEKAMKAGVERVMANSPYGDLFDAITPDFPDQTSFKRILPAYPCAILCGEYGENRELTAILRDYVGKGGTLVLSSAQLDTFPVDLAELKPLENRAFCGIRLGRGRVIVGQKPYLTAWEGANEAEASERARTAVTRGQPKRFEDIEWLLGSLVKRFSPIAVRGNVQWGVNKVGEVEESKGERVQEIKRSKVKGQTEDDNHHCLTSNLRPLTSSSITRHSSLVTNSWLVYLINNAGVIKFASSAPEFLPGGSEVEVDLRRLGATTAKEIITGKDAVIADGVLKITVPSGGVAIFEIVPCP